MTVDRLALAWVLGLGLAGSGGCSDGGEASTTGDPPATTTGQSTTQPPTTTVPTTTVTADPSTTASPSEATTQSPTETTAPDDSETTAGSTGVVGCRKNVLLMGYWPPTNEMLRPWSTDPAQNPGPWIGEDWGGHGFDVYAFFPEFPPDGDPTNDNIGDDGAVGSPRFDLRVDYQATSADFWRLVDEYSPVVLVTTSRGGGIGWEIEAIEGGHGQGNPGNPAFDWISDGYGDEQFPTEATIDPRSWTAISTYRQGQTLPTALPVPEVLAAASALGLTQVAVDDTGTSGNFLSGFLGLHGLYYNLTASHNVAAGHIHVGFGLPVASASALIEASLHAILEVHPAASLACPE